MLTTFGRSPSNSMENLRSKQSNFSLQPTTQASRENSPCRSFGRRTSRNEGERREAELVFGSQRAFRGGNLSRTCAWDTGLSASENKRLIVANNTVGAPSDGWLRQFTKTLNRRLDLSGCDAVLIELVQSGWHIEDWQPVYLWHACHHDLLLWRFFSEWLFFQREQGIVVITVGAATDFVTAVAKESALLEEWNEDTRRRTAPWATASIG